MAATLRAGLSLGLCGFSFWSHDIGGFVHRTPRDLYRRWMPFGMLTSHSRCHGAPPKEPWAYGEEFTDDFRRAAELKYGLMPYVYAQARLCSERGFPMLRTLFFEYPEDPTSWQVEDEYLFGESLLVAPLFEEHSSRYVYLPPGRWVDYQSGIAYDGGAYHEIPAGEISVALLVREGTAIPHAKVAPHTGEMDWHELELRVFAGESPTAVAGVRLPEDDTVHGLRLDRSDQGFSLADDPLRTRVNWQITLDG
jgi:alpha-D-xyloside xylohydrolase